MSNAGSFNPPHYGGTDLLGALARARELLGSGDDLGHLNSTQLLAWHLLNDACRLATAVPYLLEAGVADPKIPAESVAVIARKVLEHVIFLEYVHENRVDEALVDRFLANCRAAASRAYERPGADAYDRPPWPTYQQMAETQPALYQLYRRLSYLAHPKTCFPYSLVERDSGMSASDYFSARTDLAVADLAQILHIGVDSAWAIGVTSKA